jgi:membrane-associated phospholipid phosphatase
MKRMFDLVVFCVLVSVPLEAQGPQDDKSAPDDPSGAAASAQAPQPSAAGDRPVSWKMLFPNIASDQKRIWSYPFTIVHGQNWVAPALILGATAGFVTADPVESQYFRRTSAFHPFNNVFSGKATVLGTIAAPLSLYGAGLIRRDTKMQRTALLAGEAVADAEILTTVLKDATARLRPADVSRNGNMSDTWFESRGSRLRGNGSFPSGHTIAAFSIATVVARRYGNHHWVPFAAYGMAAVIGFSRLSLSSHFASDVFMGGALGYSISRFGVLRQ